MRVLIIEDEINNANYLVRELQTINREIEVVAILEGVQQSIVYLKQKLDFDLIFMDIHLRDGSSFEIFEKVAFDIPVIFITAFDEYIVNAFKVNVVDYLLKPLDSDQLSKALAKFNRFKNHFSVNQLNSILQRLNTANRKKIIVKKGQNFQALALSDVVYFFVENKIVFCLDKLGRKYITEWTYLNDASAYLDEALFFKANRKFFINYNFIKGYKSIDFGKTHVEMDAGFSTEPITISQERSGAFKIWIRHS